MTIRRSGRGPGRSVMVEIAALGFPVDRSPVGCSASTIPYSGEEVLAEHPKRRRNSRFGAQHPQLEDSPGRLAGVGLEGHGDVALPFRQVLGKPVDLIIELLGAIVLELLGGELRPVDQ